MKQSIFFVFLLLLMVSSLNSQGLRGMINKATKKDSSGKSSIDKMMGSPMAAGLSSDEIANGLKEALKVGTEKGTTKLSAADGFFKDAAIKILMPEEAQKAEQKLRSIGLGKQVDNAILTMNRAAEDAAKSAALIFINAIKSMSIQDAVGILKGGDFAATNFLKNKTTLELTNMFRPVIETSLQKVDATKYWNTVFTNYNRISADKVNPDLTAYVTEKALAGILPGRFRRATDKKRSGCPYFRYLKESL